MNQIRLLGCFCVQVNSEFIPLNNIKGTEPWKTKSNIMEVDLSQILKRKKKMLFLQFCFGFGNFTIREGKTKAYTTFIVCLIRFLIYRNPSHSLDTYVSKWFTGEGWIIKGKKEAFVGGVNECNHNCSDGFMLVYTC